MQARYPYAFVISPTPGSRVENFSLLIFGLNFLTLHSEHIASLLSKAHLRLAISSLSNTITILLHTLSNDIRLRSEKTNARLNRLLTNNRLLDLCLADEDCVPALTPSLDEFDLLFRERAIR